MPLDLRLATAGLLAALALGACGGLAVPTPTPAAGLSSGQRAPAVPTFAPGASAPAVATEQVAAATAVPGVAGAPAAADAPGAGTPTPPAGPAVAPTAGAGAAAAPTVASARPAEPAATAAAKPSAPGAAGAPTPAAAVAGAAPTAPAVAAAPAAALPAPTPTAAAPAAAAPAGQPPPAAPTPVVIGGAGSGAGGPPPAVPPAAGCGPNAQLFGLYAWNAKFDADVNDLARAREACATLGQILISWRTIEFTQGYNDAYFGKDGAGFDSTAILPVDRRVKQLVDAGLQPILLVTEPPEWALVTPETQGPLKADKVAKYVDFVRRLVLRYGAAPYNARHVVLWPEPDHRGAVPAGCSTALAHHRAWGDAPDQFVQMLKATYPALKAARPDVQVIMGAVAYDNWGGSNRPDFNSGSCGSFNYTFLDDVVAAGGASFFDVFAFNSYGVFSVGWEQKSSGYDIAAKSNYIRQKFPALQSKPFMVLEAGVWSAGPAVPVRLPDGSVGTVQPNEEWQAAYPAKLFSRGMSVGLRGILWYVVRDGEGDDARGLVDRNNQPKSSHRAFREAVQRLSGAQFQSILNVGPNAEGYLFQLPSGGRLAVVWAVGEMGARATVSVQVPGGNLRAFDALGNGTAVQSTGDTASLTVGHSPIYLVSGP